MLNSEKGFTLIELLIASLISLASIATAIHFYSVASGHLTKQLQSHHLRNTLQDILFLMETDIRRSGYWAFETTQISIFENLFQTTANDISIQAYPNEKSKSCILYAYDIDQDGKVGVGKCDKTGCAENTDSDNVEQLGFRLKDKAIQMRYSGKSFTCDTGRWQGLTEQHITVSDFSITMQSECLNLSVAGTDCLPEHHQQLARNITVSIAASLERSSIPAIAISKTIHLKNDKVMIAGTAQ